MLRHCPSWLFWVALGCGADAGRGGALAEVEADAAREVEADAAREVEADAAREVEADADCAPRCGGTDFMPGGRPLPIVIAAARWGDGDDADGAATSFVTRASDERFHLSIRRQADELAAYLDRAAGVDRGFEVRCTGGTACPAERTHPPGAPAIWFGTARDFASDPVVRLAFGDPLGPVPEEARQRYVLRPAGDSYYVIGATERATDPAMWSLLYALGLRHFAPGPAWEVLPRLPSPAVVDVARDETPRAWFHGLLMQPDPQSGFGQEEWLRHNRMGDDTLRPLQGQAVSGSHHHPDLPEQQRLAELVPHVLGRWREELSSRAPSTRACHEACLAGGGDASSCALTCLPLGRVPPETLCAPIFPDAPAINMQASDPVAQAAIDDHFALLAITFFRAYPHADTFSLELSDRTTPCCDGGCCDVDLASRLRACLPSPGVATTDAYVALANRVAARLRACPAAECPWNDPATPARKRVVTAVYNMTGTPPSIAYDRDVVAMANLDHAAPDALEQVAARAASATVGYYGYGFFDRGRLSDTHPDNAADYLLHLAALDARAAPHGNRWVFVESYRAAIPRAVQWQATFQYLYGGAGTRARADEIARDFFATAFPEPTSRERVRRFYDELRVLEATPSDAVLGRLFGHVAEARALAVAACTASLCGAPDDARYERMLDRFDSLTLYLHGQALIYHRLDARPHEGVFRWADAIDPDRDLVALGEHYARSAEVVGAQGAALFDGGADRAALDAYRARHPEPATPYSRAEIADLSAAGRALFPAVPAAGDDGVGRAPVFSDVLVAPPAGTPVACAEAGACGDFALPPEQAATTFHAFDYELALGPVAALPWVVGLGESPGYFVQVYSEAERRWLDLFDGRQVRSAPANCAPLDLDAAERATVASLAGRRVRLLAGANVNSAPGVCEREVWGAGSALRALRAPLSLRGDAATDVATTVHHFYVPPGLTRLDVYGLEGACLVAPSGETIAVGEVGSLGADGVVDPGGCRFAPGVPCACTADGRSVRGPRARFVAGTFLRETSIPLDGASWGIWRMYKQADATLQPMTLRNAPPYFAARAELLPVPAECVGADARPVERCGLAP